jgi:hypothetical protein
MDEKEVDEVWQKFLTWINVPALIICAIVFLIAIFALMVRFGRL